MLQKAADFCQHERQTALMTGWNEWKTKTENVRFHSSREMWKKIANQPGRKKYISTQNETNKKKLAGGGELHAIDVQNLLIVTTEPSVGVTALLLGTIDLCF
jgi:hypothetical protein